MSLTSSLLIDATGPARPAAIGARLAAVLAASIATGAVALAPYSVECSAILAVAALLAGCLALSLRALAALRHRTPQLAALAGAARLGVWRQDAGSATAAWSDELQRLLGVVLPCPTGAEQLGVLHPDDRPAAQALARRVATTLRPEGLDLRALHPVLGERHLRWEILPETDRQGRLLALWGYAQDITDRHADESRQMQAGRMDALGQMAAGLAHDFNNLLCAVVLNLDMLTIAGRRADRSDIAEPAARARAAAERGAELTGQLLAFAGKRPMLCQHLDVSQAVRASLAALPPAPGVRLALSLQDDGAVPMRVEADPAQLHAAVQALLAHAQAAVAGHARRGAAPHGAGDGLVHVSIGETALTDSQAAMLDLPPGRYAEIAVHDDAEAPLADLLPRHMEPFFRAAPDGSDPNGNGVHLALAHGVARGHGGCLTLEATPGEGTTARLLLPLLAARPAAAPLAPPPSARAEQALSGVRPLPGLRVLLVEDDPEVRQTTEALLRDNGAVVTTAEDGASALALLDGELAFDFLLSDVVLPGWLSGIDVVEAAARLRPGLPALLASGYAAPAEELGRALPAGVALLHKPYRRAALLDAIAATLGAPAQVVAPACVRPRVAA